MELPGGGGYRAPQGFILGGLVKVQGGKISNNTLQPAATMPGSAEVIKQVARQKL